ncbi:MAG: DUF1294 domain-containing protein [Lachnospiraceae bacterium]|nr:DUF1294 domain-containing protein [Lachnospiraceae bacterium]
MGAKLTLILALVIPNIIGFAFMGFDKNLARQGEFRIPESVLFCIALIGGSAGSLIGMYVFHHKTKKWRFVIGMPLILFVWVACFVLLWRSSLQFRFL